MTEKEALSKLQKMCSQQEKSTFDVKKKLLEWKVAENSIERIIDKLKKDNFINDTRYAVSFVRDKFRFQKWGKVKIAYLLRLKGIDSQDIQQALEEINEEEYSKILFSELLKKKATLKNSDRRTEKAKLIRYGQSKGFEFEIIKDVVEKIVGK